MKIKNKLSFVLVFLLSLFFQNLIIHAGSFSAYTNKTTVTVGNTVKLTLNVSDQAGRFLISSSNNSILSGGIDEFYDNSTNTIYFTAKKVGEAIITIKAVDVTNYDGTSANGVKSIKIKVVSPNSNKNSNNKNNTIDINKKYSDDNYLKSLKIENYDIAFEREKQNYELEVDEDVASINLTATPSSSSANVQGTGNIKLTDGINNIKITVVAENGNERVYQINVTVKDLNPIKVYINKKMYTVVKKVDQLTFPDNFSQVEATIDNKKVPALYNDITGYILVGLKDDLGNVKLYVYDSKKNTYSIYNEFSFNSVKLFYTNPKNVPRGFKKIKINLNGENIQAYTTDKKSDFYLVYGMNVNTGEIGFYRYDKKENTLQRYETKDLENLSFINNKYLITIAFLSTSVLMLMLFMLIMINNIKKK